MLISEEEFHNWMPVLAILSFDNQSSYFAEIKSLLLYTVWHNFLILKKVFQTMNFAITWTCKMYVLYYIEKRILGKKCLWYQAY